MNNKDHAGNTPLHNACFQGQIQCVTSLLKLGKAQVSPKDENGDTPLHLGKIISFVSLELLKF